MTEIFEKVVNTWGEESPHVVVFSRMIAELKPNAVSYLPLTQLRGLLGQGIPDAMFDRVIFWFSSDAMNLFEVWYEYLKDEMDEEEISSIDVVNAIRNGDLVLSSGAVVRDFREHLYPFFRGTDTLERVLRAARGSND